MVSGISSLMRIRKKIAFALSVAFLMASFTACHQIIQPTLSDIAKANFSYLEEPLNVSISLDCMNDTLGVYYNSEVHCHGADVLWNGRATVYFMETYFVQECISQRDAEQGVKQWRGSWATKDLSSPVDIFQEWMFKVESGACIYEKTPQTIFIDGMEHQVYEISFQEETVGWESFCDADFDSLFGGNELFTDMHDCDITLFIDIDSLLLTQAIITFYEDAWCETLINIESTNTVPDISWDFTPVDQAFFNEEWEILGTVKNSAQAD